MTLPEDNNQIFAGRYQTVLSSKEELKQLLEDKNCEEDYAVERTEYILLWICLLDEG